MISLAIADGTGRVLKQSSATDYVTLVYERAYCEGDRIVVEGDPGSQLVVMLEDSMGPAQIYLSGQR